MDAVHGDPVEALDALLRLSFVRRCGLACTKKTFLVYPGHSAPYRVQFPHPGRFSSHCVVQRGVTLASVISLTGGNR